MSPDPHRGRFERPLFFLGTLRDPQTQAVFALLGIATLLIAALLSMPNFVSNLAK